MPLTKLQLRPGINREGTVYSNTGGWYDCNLIRFRMGYPERWGGWEKFGDNTYLGTARALHEFVALTGSEYRGVGTHLKLYVEAGQAYNDITPIRATNNLGTDPITTGSSGSGIITINDTAHGALINDFVTISGATAVDGITADEINTEHQITEIVDSNNYKVDTGGSASAGSTSGGGGSVTAEYQINTGLDSSFFGTGWGADGWGEGGWGEAAESLTAGDKLRLWSMDNFGEDLLANVRDGGVYFWDTSAGFTSNRAIPLTEVTNADDPPTIGRKVLVADESRHAIVFGCNQVGESDQDLLAIRWCDAEDISTWIPSTDNSAGGLRIGSGTEIVTAVKGKQEIVVWTENAVHSLRYVGAPFIFGIRLISNNITIMSSNSAVEVDNVMYWMGTGNFYAYSGRVQVLPCTVREYVFSSLNTNQRGKVTVGVNKQDHEIIWFYPSENATENDRYVAYNYHQEIWYYGQLSRTAWLDRNLDSNPIAAATDNYLYRHERGCDDGSTSPASAINAYIESSDIELGDGERFGFVREIIPDLSFNGSTGSDPTVKFTITARKEPGGNYVSETAQSSDASKTTPVQQYTTNLYVRVRGRAMKLRVENDETGVFWRLGVPRVNVRPDGRR